MHLLAEALHLTFRSCPPLLLEQVFRFDAKLFNVPFSFSVALLLYVAWLAFVHGRQARPERPSMMGWWLIGAGCCAIVLAMIIGARQLVVGTLFMVRRFPALLVGVSAVVLAAGAVLVRFGWQLDPQTRRRLLVAAAVYILGAGCFEALSEAYCGRRFEPGMLLVYVVVSTIEETLETASFLLTARALLLHRPGL